LAAMVRVQCREQSALMRILNANPLNIICSRQRE
jgi:hypothetical protein